MTGASFPLSARATSGWTRTVKPLGNSASVLRTWSTILERYGRRGLHPGASLAVRAGAAEDALKRPLDALSSQDHQTELVDLNALGGRAILPQRLFERLKDSLLISPLLHVDEVDDDDSAEVSKPDLVDDLLDRLDVDAGDGVFEPPVARVAAGVDVDRYQRLGLVDDDVAART